METNIEREGLKYVSNIEQELEEIKERSPSPRQAFWNGILQGGGAVVGGVIAIVILGFALSEFGVLPGFHYFVPYLQNALDKFSR